MPCHADRACCCDIKEIWLARPCMTLIDRVSAVSVFVCGVMIMMHVGLLGMYTYRVMMSCTVFFAKQTKNETNKQNHA